MIAVIIAYIIKSKKYLLIFIVALSLFFNLDPKNIIATVDNNILIIASYSPDNDWESDVIKGIKNNKIDNYYYQIEYLDSKSANYESYKENFHNYINLKYKHIDFDIIITIDDEAFDFARESLSDKNSILFSQKLIFARVNQYVDLNTIEKQKITGILDYQNNLSILNTNDNLKNISVLLDDSIYCKTLKDNFMEIQDYTNMKVSLKFINDTN